MKRDEALRRLRLICNELEDIYNTSNLTFDSVNLLGIKEKLELVMMDNLNFIRMLNMETGEVKQADATLEGYKALSSLIEREVEMYNDFLKGRNPLEDIIFEGNDELCKLLKSLLITTSNKILKK